MIDRKILIRKFVALSVAYINEECKQHPTNCRSCEFHNGERCCFQFAYPDNWDINFITNFYHMGETQYE